MKDHLKKKNQQIQDTVDDYINYYNNERHVRKWRICNQMSTKSL